MLYSVCNKCFSASRIKIGQFDNDLTKNGQKNGEPLGERIVF